MNVIKKDGRIVQYDESKIENAIIKAFEEVDGEITKDAINKSQKISEDISNQIQENISVEEIQNMVEAKLMSCKRKDVAKAYIIYRNDRDRIRQQKSLLMKNISEKITASNVQNQNANMDEHTFSGRIGEASDAVLKEYALNNCMSEMSRNNHLNNEIYIHDLNSYAVGMHNCLSVPFDDLLAKGVKTRQTDIRPPQSISTAMQLVAVIFQLQSLEQFGGVSATHLDWTMIPYVRKSYYKHFRDGLNYLDNNVQYELFCNNFTELMDRHDVPINNKEWGIKGFYPADAVYKYALDLTEKEIYQAVEAMYHNLNTLQSRSGGQLPFSSINYGTCTLEEGQMVTKALLQVSIDGLGSKHRTSIFPCGIFQCMNGVNRHSGDPNYDLFKMALRSTAQRLYPNYANVDWSGNAGYDRNDPKTYFSTMGKQMVQK